jgi:hypothetical protein
MPGAGYLDLKGIAPEDLTADDFVFRGTTLLSVRSDAGYNSMAVSSSLGQSTPVETYGDTGYFLQGPSDGYSFFVHGVSFTYAYPDGNLRITGGTITGVDTLDADGHLVGRRRKRHLPVRGRP